MKTYSRLKRATYSSSKPPAKKRRILDHEHHSHSDAILHSDAASYPLRSSLARETSISASPPSSTPPSSPPLPPTEATARKTSISASLPSSTPPPPLPPTEATTPDPTSPLVLPKRKTTFSFFARREAAAAAAAATAIPRPSTLQPTASDADADADADARAPQPAVDKTTRSADEPLPRQRQPPPQPQRRLTQLQLDLGGAPVQRACRTCGMAYVPSNAEDAALHKRFHAMNAGGVDVGRGFFAAAAARRSGEAVVWEGKGAEGDFVVAVGRGGRAAARARVRRVLDVVERELGAVHIPDRELWGQAAVGGGEAGGERARKDGGARGADADGEAGLRPQGAGISEAGGDRARAEAAMRADRFKAYLYVRGSKCIGLCLTERIAEAHRVVAPPPKDSSNGPQEASAEHTKTPDDQTNSNNTAEPPRDSSTDGPSPTTPTPANTPGTIATSPTTYPADLGISRIWVSSSHRRHGIALALLDAAARDSRTYRCEEYGGGDGEKGKRLLKERIAFSQPTDAGSRLARRWFGADIGWGVYW